MYFLIVLFPLAKLIGHLFTSFDIHEIGLVKFCEFCSIKRGFMGFHEYHLDDCMSTVPANAVLLMGRR